VQRRRVTRRGAGGRLPRRAATTRDKTGRGETQTQPVAVSTARLLTVVIRVQILQHCVRQSTQASRSQPVPATAACCLRPRLVVVLACTTPSRLSAPSYQQICLRLHTDAYSRCQGLLPALHAGISSTAVRSVRGVVRAADRTCYQQRARHPDAEPCTHQTKRCRSP
jgi:hypothetical protein